MRDESNELTESYYRCQQDEAFLDTFYELFLAKSPAIAELFSQTDFTRQKLMLRQSLLEVILFDRSIVGTREEIERLGRRHHELGVTNDMYDMWVDALCAAVAQHDPEFTSELEQIWRTAMQKSIQLMKESL